jgi:ComF family protein
VLLSSGIAQSLLDLLFPPRCLHCGTAGTARCPARLATARAPEPPLYSRCGRPLGSMPTKMRGDCAACAGGRRPAALATLRAGAVYVGVVREAILALKYRGRRGLAAPLGTLLAQAMRREGVAVDIIMPVPLHSGRRRLRGYNQAELLARECARHFGVSYRGDLVLRLRTTPPQVGLFAPERAENVKGAFVLASPEAAMALAGQRIALVDAVTTTGSSLDPLAATLLVAGPVALHGFAVTRSELSEDRGPEQIRFAPAAGARRTRPGARP